MNSSLLDRTVLWSRKGDENKNFRIFWHVKIFRLTRHNFSAYCRILLLISCAVIYTCIHVIVSLCSRNHFISEKHKTSVSFKLYLLQNKPFKPAAVRMLEIILETNLWNSFHILRFVLNYVLKVLLLNVYTECTILLNVYTVYNIT